jgi:hypothetical protein
MNPITAIAPKAAIITIAEVSISLFYIMFLSKQIYKVNTL